MNRLIKLNDYRIRWWDSCEAETKSQIGVVNDKSQLRMLCLLGLSDYSLPPEHYIYRIFHIYIYIHILYKYIYIYVQYYNIYIYISTYALYIYNGIYPIYIYIYRLYIIHGKNNANIYKVMQNVIILSFNLRRAAGQPVPEIVKKG